MASQVVFERHRPPTAPAIPEFEPNHLVQVGETFRRRGDGLWPVRPVLGRVIAMDLVPVLGHTAGGGPIERSRIARTRHIHSPHAGLGSRLDPQTREFSLKMATAGKGGL